MSNIETYIAAKRRLSEVKMELTVIGAKLRDTATRLISDPEKVVFADTNVGLPGGLEQGRLARAQEWPTPATIQRLVVQHYEARCAMETAWATIPEADRRELQPPHNR